MQEEERQRVNDVGLKCTDKVNIQTFNQSDMHNPKFTKAESRLVFFFKFLKVFFVTITPSTALAPPFGKTTNYLHEIIGDDSETQTACAI